MISTINPAGIGTRGPLRRFSDTPVRSDRSRGHTPYGQPLTASPARETGPGTGRNAALPSPPKCGPSSEEAGAPRGLAVAAIGRRGPSLFGYRNHLISESLAMRTIPRGALILALLAGLGAPSRADITSITAPLTLSYEGSITYNNFEVSTFTGRGDIVSGTLTSTTPETSTIAYDANFPSGTASATLRLTDV